MKQHNHQTCKPLQSAAPAVALSADGYIRMRFETFKDTAILHLLSGIDDDRPSTTGVGANYSDITGYTEWVSDSQPTITIGWDWLMTGVSGVVSLIHAGVPGSNLMFLDDLGQDLGPVRTRQLLLGWLDRFSWQPETLKALGALQI